MNNQLLILYYIKNNTLLIIFNFLVISKEIPNNINQFFSWVNSHN